MKENTAVEATSTQLRDDSFTRFHGLTCLTGFLLLVFGSLIILSGMFLNVRPFNCTAAAGEPNNTDSEPELAWSEYQGFRSSLSLQYRLCWQATGDLTNVAFLIGTIVGSLLAGPTSDTVGRKPCILAGLMSTALASLLSNYAPSLELHLASRALAGFCLMFAQCAVQVYGSEVHSPRHRSRFLAAWSSGVSAGTLASGVLAHLTRDHQLYVLLACCLPVGPLLMALCLPESPAWLDARGRPADAEAARRRIEVINGRGSSQPPPPASSPFRIGGCGPGWNRRLARLACLLGLHGLFVGLNCYGFYFVMGGVIPDVCLYAVLMGATQLPNFFLLNLVPRRAGLLACSLLSGLLSLSFGAAVQFKPSDAGNGSYGILLAVFGASGCFCSVSAFNLLVSASAEYFPVGIRNTSLGLCTLCLRCGSALAPLVNFLPDVPMRSLALGCPLLLTCLPLGLGLGFCGRAYGCQIRYSQAEASDDQLETDPTTGKLMIPIGASQIEVDIKP